MKRELNKWQWGIKFEKCPPWTLGFYPYVRVWFLKFTSFPDEGEMFNKKNYKGFFWEWNMRGDFVVTTRAVVVPPKLRKALSFLGIGTHAVYSIPRLSLHTK